MAEIVSLVCSDIKSTSMAAIFRDLYVWFCNNIGVPNHLFTILDDRKYVTIIGIVIWGLYFIARKEWLGMGGRFIRCFLLERSER